MKVVAKELDMKSVVEIVEAEGLVVEIVKVIVVYEFDVVARVDKDNISREMVLS